MKIMKSVDKKVGDTTYYKYKINLPKKVVEDSDFLNRELNINFEKDKIIIETELKQNYKRKLTDKEKKIQKEVLKLMNIK